ncbi:MAG TPA: DUF4349 domain-containing protein [Gemmatimonadales bacterium]|nr:DUF4349 domain-containing protein [Gemmatimonadales bacterium]
MITHRLLLAALTALAACTQQMSRSDESEGTAGFTQDQAPPAAAPPAPEVAVGAARGSAPPPQGQPADSAAPRMLIRTGDASVEVDSLETAVERLRALTERLGGFVANTTYQGGRDRVREASLELRVPADRFEAMQTVLDSVGEVEWLNVAVQDVGEEYVDLSARTANARRLETRLVELLATRTGKLEDVLAVERELARVREEIERYEGRLRFLRTRVATSTLTVRLHEPAPVIGGRGETGVIGEAFRQAWRNFISAIAALIAWSGALIPLLAVAAAAWLLIRRYRRARPPAAPKGENLER